MELEPMMDDQDEKPIKRHRRPNVWASVSSPETVSMISLLSLCAATTMVVGNSIHRWNDGIDILSRNLDGDVVSSIFIEPILWSMSLVSFLFGRKKTAALFAVFGVARDVDDIIRAHQAHLQPETVRILAVCIFAALTTVIVTQCRVRLFDTWSKGKTFCFVASATAVLVVAPLGVDSSGGSNSLPTGSNALSLLEAIGWYWAILPLAGIAIAWRFPRLCVAVGVVLFATVARSVSSFMSNVSAVNSANVTQGLARRSILSFHSSFPGLAYSALLPVALVMLGSFASVMEANNSPAFEDPEPIIP